MKILRFETSFADNLIYLKNRDFSNTVFSIQIIIGFWLNYCFVLSKYWTGKK